MEGSSGPGCDSGIASLGRIAWGSHFCNFYRAQSDLAEFLVPFFLFSEYEAKLHGAVRHSKVVVLCSYSLEHCTAADVLQVLTHHDFAVVRNEKGWQRIESSTLKASS